MTKRERESDEPSTRSVAAVRRTKARGGDREGDENRAPRARQGVDHARAHRGERIDGEDTGDDSGGGA